MMCDVFIDITALSAHKSSISSVELLEAHQYKIFLLPTVYSTFAISSCKFSII